MPAIELASLLTLLQVAVGAHHVDVVVEEALARSRVRVEHPVDPAPDIAIRDRVRDALSQRAIVTSTPGVWWSSGWPGSGPPRAERLEVLELEAESAEESWM